MHKWDAYEKQIKVEEKKGGNKQLNKTVDDACWTITSVLSIADELRTFDGTCEI